MTRFLDTTADRPGAACAWLLAAFSSLASIPSRVMVWAASGWAASGWAASGVVLAKSANEDLACWGFSRNHAAVYHSLNEERWAVLGYARRLIAMLAAWI